MTMYFPLVVHGAMLIEPTESESKESLLDRFIHVLRTMALEAGDKKTARFEGAPRLSPRRRLDETAAAASRFFAGGRGFADRCGVKPENCPLLRSAGRGRTPITL